MRKICLPLATFSLLIPLFFIACQGGAKPQPNPENTAATIDTALIARPDGQDLLKLLQGKWQSETDSVYQLEIIDSLVLHRYAGQVQLQASIEIDAACSNSACVAEGLPNDGWCFIEKSSAGAQCMLILKCDEKMLEMRALGAANSQLSFKKL